MKTILLAFLLLFVNLISGQCPPGDVTFNSQSDVDDFIAAYPNCESIAGDLLITGAVNNLNQLDYLYSIEGDFLIINTELTSITNFNNLTLVLNNIEILGNSMLTEIIGFDELVDLSHFFNIENNPNLVTIDGFNRATDVYGDFWISGNPSLQTLNGFSRLAVTGSFLGINDCPALVSIPSFNNMIYVGWGIQFYNTGLTNITGFDNLESIGGTDPTSGFVVSNNANLVSLTGFNCLDTIVYDLLIQENPLLEDISGISNLQSVGQFFTIRNNASLTTLNGLQSLNSVSTTGYETSVTLAIHDNPQLSDCNPLCNLLASNGIIGFTNIAGNATGCDSEAEIDTSNCIPFAGIDCTSLISPLDGEINVAVDTNLSWNPIAGTTSYVISIGTSPEGAQIADNLNVGNITTYNLPNNLPESTEIFVKVKPNNSGGQAKCCAEESFITEAVIPECTTLFNPTNGAINVPISTSINWNSVVNATGYIISVGTFSGGTDILNQLDVGNTTSYNTLVNLPEDTTLFVTIIPYNSNGSATECMEESFTTQAEALDCTNLLNPLNDAVDVAINTALTWNTVANASGYILNIGLTPSGSEITNNLDLGNVTSFNIPEAFPISTQIYVNIIPYNSFGQALDCQTESFTTKRESLFIPKFFTPNNDGDNDIWIIKDPLDEIDVVYIYNRYGKLLKSLYDIQNGWTGLFNNQLLPVSDYWYVIQLNSGSKIKGHFTLKR